MATVIIVKILYYQWRKLKAVIVAVAPLPPWKYLIQNSIINITEKFQPIGNAVGGFKNYVLLTLHPFEMAFTTDNTVGTCI